MPKATENEYAYDTLDDAVAGEREIFAKIVAEAKANGYTVINNEIIGKNAKTGEDRPDAQRTTMWAWVDIGDGDGKYLLPEPADTTKRPASPPAARPRTDARTPGPPLPAAVNGGAR